VIRELSFHDHANNKQPSLHDPKVDSLHDSSEKFSRVATGSGQPGEMEKLLQTFSGFHRFVQVFETMMGLMKKFKRDGNI